MTREEAIEILQEQRRRYCEDNYLDSDYKIVVNAFDMAVKALEQEPCDKCEVGNPCLYCKHEFEQRESEAENEISD